MKRAVMVGLLLAACAGRLLAGPVVGEPRVESKLLLGSGAAFFSDAGARWRGEIGARPGFRGGLLIAVPQSRQAALELGLLLDVRGSATRECRCVVPPKSRRNEERHVYTLTYLTAPLHLRFASTEGSVRPYVTFGPELSLLLLAYDTEFVTILERTDRSSVEFSNSADRYSGGLYLGFGCSRAIQEHDCSLEAGLYLGLEDIGVRSKAGSRYSEIGGSRARLVGLSLGMVL